MKSIKNIYKTVAMVTAFSVAERFLGFLYRIFLSRTLGAEGLGIYQIAISVLGLFMTITSSGIPITVSRILTKNKSEKRQDKDAQTVTAAILTAVAICVPITLAAAINETAFGFLFSDPRCNAALMIMIPGLIFTSVYAVIRGSFWGNTQFLSYSLIEFAEEAVMMIAGIILVNNAVDFLDGANKASLAVLISYLFSFAVSSLVYFARGGRLKLNKNAFKPLIASSTPITVMRTCTSLIGTAVSLILPARIVFYGASNSVAMAEFGKVFGMAMPLISMPSSLIGSLALVLVPEVSENFYSGKFLTLKGNVEKAVRFSCFVACVIMPAFLALGKELGVILYGDETAGNYVIKAAVVMLPLSLSIISTSLLNSLGKEKQTLTSFLLGASALIVCIYFLPKFIGVESLVLGLALNYGITAAINLFLLKKTLPARPKYSAYILKSFVIALPTALFGSQLKSLLLRICPPIITVAVCAAITAALQLSALYVFGMIDFQRKASLIKERKNPGKTAKSSA